MNETLIKIKRLILIAFQLHSKAPTKEIKRLWEIVAICLTPITLLELFSGDKIFFGLIPTIKSEFVYWNGGFLFCIFVTFFIIVFFDIKKCKEITIKIQDIEKKRHKS